MIFGANPFEISDIQEDEAEGFVVRRGRVRALNSVGFVRGTDLADYQGEKANGAVVQMVQLESPLERLTDCSTVPFLESLEIKGYEVLRVVKRIVSRAHAQSRLGWSFGERQDNRRNRCSGCPQRRRDRFTQPSSGSDFRDVRCLTAIKRGPHNVTVVVKCQEDYPRPRRFLPDHLGSFDTIQAGQGNIQNYDVRLQFTCFLDSLLPIGRFGDDLPFWIRRQDLANSRPPARGMIDDENTRKCEMCHDSARLSNVTLHPHTAFRLPRKRLTSHGRVLTIWVFGTKQSPTPADAFR